MKRHFLIKKITLMIRFILLISTLFVCASTSYGLAPSTPSTQRWNRLGVYSSSNDNNENNFSLDEKKNQITDESSEEIKFERQVSKLSTADMMRAMGTSPRRVALSFLSASGIALAGNFLGVTSKLLTVIPEDTVEASGLDTYFPRGEFKRCRSRGYTFVIPREWVADTFVELAKAQRQAQPLDLQMKRRVDGTLPDSAYGPPGRLNQKGVSESGDTNVSVIVTQGLRDFTLQGTLGEPKEAAEKLLRVSIAPEGSGRVAILRDAVADEARRVYQFEYDVDRGTRGLPLKNISVVAAGAQGDKLYTLTVVAPLKKFEDSSFANKMRKVASSFHLTT